MRRFLVAAILAGSAFPAELPVRTVILYKHGVGYFERSGEMRAGESARLDFKASAMNDVLKSLTIEDKSGAKVTGLRYDSSEPLDKRLADYPFQLSPKQALSAFLDQIKGARVEVKAPGGAFAGSIMGARAFVAGERGQEKEQLILLLDSGEIRTFEMDALSSLKLADAALERQLKDYLSAMAVNRSKEERSVYIDSTDTRARQVIASYMIPTPVWKSSYRLILRDAESMLEGWAIVDNTTGEDWTGVNLSLVSGRPISFISKLYEPKYKVRPEAELPDEGPVGPVVHAGAVQESRADVAEGRARAMLRPKLMAPAAPPMAAEFAAPVRDEMTSSVAAAAEGRELGDLFEYKFGSPVTVRKNESAMLPFLQQKITSRKLLIYSDRSTQHPMHAAEITNSSGKTLDGGPITVYDSGAYAGEALVETFKANDKRLISYGVDLGTRVTTNLDSTRDLVREIKASRGILTTKTAMQETTTYTIRNIDAKAKTLIIEHPVRPQYKVLSPKPAESTASVHRFEVKLAAGGADKFQVSEEFVYDNSLTILSLTPDQIGIYLQNRGLSAAGRKQLETIVQLKSQIADSDNQARQMETTINEVIKDQERIRQNLSSLNRVSGQQEQVNKYARELEQQEVRIAGLRDRISESRQQKAKLEAALREAIGRIEF
ncbi:MAG: hypothetical protein SFV51_13450 [Bryobacteraceae bacterium]|nr:hypothetical protein [Bryobacteraceae bacterium]